MQAILVEPGTGADAPVWRGPLSGEKSEAAITMSAYAFDTLVSTCCFYVTIVLMPHISSALVCPSLTLSDPGNAMQWPREGALAARMQLQAQEQADRAAQAAVAAQAAAQLRGRPPSARLAQRGPSAGAEAYAEQSYTAPVKEEPGDVKAVPGRDHFEQPPVGPR